LKEVTTNLDIEENLDKEEFVENMRSFFNKSAKAWQSYISYDFIKEIELSETQRKVVNTESSQIIINGSAGSGKSIVLLYKLIKAMIEEKEPQKFLYISYNQTLIEDTFKRARMYKEFENLTKKHQVVDICTFHKFASNMLKDLGYSEVQNIKIDYTNMEKIKGNAYRRISALLYKYKENGEFYNRIIDDEKLYKSHDEGFVRDEILWMKANGYVTVDLYLDCERVGRGNTPRLIKNQRKTIFKIFEEYSQEARERKWTQTNIDLEDYALTLLKKFDEIPEEKKYDYIFIDEVQDFDAMQLKLLAMLTPKSLVMAGDPKQKIYKRAPHSYINLGIDIKNNSKVLNDNFRSTEEIMNLANSLKFSDFIKDNSKIKYIIKGEKPKIMYFNKWNKALENLGSKIKKIQDLEPKATVAIITREEDSKAAGNQSDIKQYLGRYCKIMNIEQYGKKFQFENKKQVIYTDLYNVKGLEFDYVFLLQFDSNHYPSRKEVESLEKYYIRKNSDEKESDQDKDILDLLNTERKRLYVAMSRAKKSLEMFCVMETERAISPFIKDFDKNDYEYCNKIVKR